MKAIVVMLALSITVEARAQESFTVVNFGSSAYRIDGVNNPTLDLARGQTYIFNVTAIGHPFYIKTSRVTGNGSQYLDGVTGQGATSGPLTFVVPMDAPKGLFYQCGVHSFMGGTVIITDPVAVSEDGVPDRLWLAPPTPNPTHEGASFKFGLPRSATIEFTVFDVRGRRVRELSGGRRQAGAHILQWDGRDLGGRVVPNGLYPYRLRVGDEARSGRLVVMR